MQGQGRLSLALAFFCPAVIFYELKILTNFFVCSHCAVAGPERPIVGSSDGLAAVNGVFMKGQESKRKNGGYLPASNLMVYLPVSNPVLDAYYCQDI